MRSWGRGDFSPVPSRATAPRVGGSAWGSQFKWPRCPFSADRQHPPNIDEGIPYRLPRRMSLLITYPQLQRRVATQTSSESLIRLTVSQPQTNPLRMKYRVRSISAFAGGLTTAMALAATGASVLAQTAIPVDSIVVGRLGLEIPTSESFVLHGTLPIPPGTWDGQGNPNLDIVDSNGNQIEDTQVEVVSRYASASQGVDIVELIARVERRADWAPGQYRSFNVVKSETGNASGFGTPDITDLYSETFETIGSEILSLIQDPRGIVILATDVFGNEYGFFPLAPNNSIEVERFGPYKSTVRSFGVMQNFTNDDDAYPHLFGVHAYMSTVEGSDSLQLDLRISNGMDGREQSTLDDILGRVYFENIQILLRDNEASDWRVQQQFDNPGFGGGATQAPSSCNFLGLNYQGIDLVEALPSGAQQMMNCRSQFIRRLAISPLADTGSARELLDRAGQAFAVVPNGNAVLWNWSNESTGRYFPQAHTLPRLRDNSTNYNELTAVRNLYSGQLMNLESNLAAGTQFDFPFLTMLHRTAAVASAQQCVNNNSVVHESSVEVRHGLGHCYCSCCTSKIGPRQRTNITRHTATNGHAS